MSPGAALASLRQRRPLIHVITAPVTAAATAAAVAALGARPILAEDPDDAAAMAAVADALVCNLGMPRPYRLEAMRRAAAALPDGAPRLLDPVGAGGTAARSQNARSLLSGGRFTLLRANGAEVGSLAGAGGQVRGTDATSDPLDVAAACRTLAARERLVVAATGALDHIAAPDGRLARVRRGHPLAAAAVGTGCMASAVIGAFAAVWADPWEAAVMALALYRIAAERAAAAAGGPGTFLPLLVDALAALSPGEVDHTAAIEVIP
ncbi:MAG TPA: hydroxyethylthiazole kinase [Bacillota bacterium]|nr:hydroxyethylthiazole kinase [Bacillota bacterium]